MAKKDEIREFIRKKYSETAKASDRSGCCSGSSCCCTGESGMNEISSKIGYTKQELERAPLQSNMGLGCGNPTAVASLKAGDVVLDLGSGGGFDCFLAGEQVGEAGHVIGVDMTPEMVALARKNAEKSLYNNVEFRLGEIEHIPVADASINVIISNCVINLSTDKKQVFKEAYRVLKPGGRLCIADVAATAELPVHIKQDLSMTAGCVAGAEHADTLRRLLCEAGFQDIQMQQKDNSRELISSWAPGSGIENYVASYIIEAHKR